jgi:hypothetical protein
MSSVSDHIQLSKSKETKYAPLFNKREWLYINDTTTQYDQGTSIIETTALSNNDKFLDYNAGYLTVPILITLTNNTTAAGLSNPTNLRKSLGFKQSFLSMINSITVDLNGQSMVQQNQLIDIYNNFRLLTSESWTSSNRWSTIGFYPDLVSEAGLSTDNNIYAPANTTASNAATNSGLTERLSYINLDFTGLSLGDVANSAVSNLIPETQIKQLYLSHISKTGVGAVDVSSPFVQYSVKATIMLKDIHPLFEVMPISKSLNFKIQVFWNNSAFTATHSAAVAAVVADAAAIPPRVGVAAATQGWTSQSSQYRAYNGTVPLMLNNWTTGFTGSNDNTTLRTSIYVGDTCYDSTQKSVAPTLSTGAVGKQVELWVPAYQMLVDVDRDYSNGHQKIITYNDYYQFSLKGVAGGDTFNHLVSNGIANLKACLIVPILSSLNNNVNIFDDGLPQSFAHINQFNVMVGGSNVLHQDSRYGYQQFNNEFFNEFGINGNQSPGIGSGLIDFKSWVKKPYYYVNCSRVPLDQQMTYRSLQIKGTNSSALPMDYYIFAIYEKNFSLDIISGVTAKIGL